MATALITQEMVNSAADALLAEGIEPSSSSVQKRLGIGSFTTAKKFLDAYVRAEAWFNNGKNKDEADAILFASTKMNQDDIAKSYDFLRKIDFFVPSAHVDPAQITNFYNAFRELDPSVKLDVGKLVMNLD